MTNSIQKGKVGERVVARMFCRWFPGSRRSFGQARKGYEQPDIIGGGIETEFFVEVKLWAKKKGTPGNLRDAWDKLIRDQVKHQRAKGDEADIMLALPILVYRLTDPKRPKRWFVACYAQELAALVGHSVKMISPLTMVVPWEHFAKWLDEEFL